jgi:hypothetical protein
MFAAKTPMRLTSCSGKQKKNAEGDRVRLVVLTFQLQPFTSEMANDLNVKGRLFSLSDGNPLLDVMDAGLKIAVPRQRMTLYAAPDDEMPASIELADVDIDPIIRVRLDREGPVYSGTFKVSFEYPSANNLLWLFHCVTEQVFATFEGAQASLLDAPETEEATN